MPRVLRVFAGLLALVATGAGACSEPPRPVPPATAEELYGAELARAACAGVHRCELLKPAKSGEACLGDCDADDCTEVRAQAPVVETYCDARADLTCDAEKRVCRARAKIGDACDPKHACATSAFCK